MSVIRQIYTDVGYGKAGSPTRLTLGQLYDRRGGGTNIDQFPGRYSRHMRSAWILTCRSWLARTGAASNRFIPLYVNPSDVNWSIPRRGTVVKTAAGAVRNTWRNRYRGTYFDEFTLNITFQSGNIMPSQGNIGTDMDDFEEFSEAVQDPQVPPGLKNFYRFLQLVDQPKLIGAMENRHIIIYHSRIFPVIRLEGFFTEDPITWSDSSTDGNRLSWTSTFQVYKTYPKINQASLLESMYKGWVKDEALNEAFPIHKLERQIALNEGKKTLASASGNRPAAQPTLQTPTSQARVVEKPSQTRADFESDFTG